MSLPFFLFSYVIRVYSTRALFHSYFSYIFENREFYFGFFNLFTLMKINKDEIKLKNFKEKHNLSFSFCSFSLAKCVETNIFIEPIHLQKIK